MRMNWMQRTEMLTRCFCYCCKQWLHVGRSSNSCNYTGRWGWWRRTCRCWWWCPKYGGCVTRGQEILSDSRGGVWTRSGNYCPGGRHTASHGLDANTLFSMVWNDFILRMTRFSITYTLPLFSQLQSPLLSQSGTGSSPWWSRSYLPPSMTWSKSSSHSRWDFPLVVCGSGRALFKRSCFLTPLVLQCSAVFLQVPCRSDGQFRAHPKCHSVRTPPSRQG